MKSNKLPKLSPTQSFTYDALVAASGSCPFLHLWTKRGLGRTTVLQHLQRKLSANIVNMQAFANLQRDREPLSFEDTFFALLDKHANSETPLIVDDVHLLFKIGQQCYSSPRQGYSEAIGRAVTNLIAQRDCQIIFGSDGTIPRSMKAIAYGHGFGTLTPEDYDFSIKSNGLAKSIDAAEVFRFAPRLNFYQICEASDYCVASRKHTTNDFIDYLRSQELASNVELKEVDSIQLSDLVGADDLIKSLESDVVFPLEDDAFAQKYTLQPKRGVLLLGPPGTGKTTIGKALAHRLKGKFFLIDGTIISGTDHFYHHVASVFEQAKQNAPSVIFVDDSDVIFESGREHGLYRYLLTMLDGLESESAGRVCVMLTAMDIRHIPPALIRSGRVELWLETKLPDKSARAALIEKLLAGLELSEMDFSLDDVAVATDGCTPADLKRLVNEAKVRYAWDEKQGKPPSSLTDYALDAVRQLKGVKKRYHQSRQENKQPGTERPVWFDVDAP